MRKSLLIGIVVSLLVLMTVGCWAADDTDTNALKEQVKALQGQLKALEDKIQAIEDTQKKKIDEDKTGLKKVDSGFGTIKVDGLLQNWYTWNSENLSGDDRDTFKTRRMEIKFSGQINPKVKWAAMIDPAKKLDVNKTVDSGTGDLSDVSIKQETRILQDALINYTLSPTTSLDVGQYKIPVGMEGLASSASLDTVERALFTIRGNKETTGVFGDFRDLGVTVRGLFDSGEYQVGLFNGEKQNNPDLNDTKSGAARVVFRPKSTPGLQFGASFFKGLNSAALFDRRRIGGELRYERNALTLASEILSGTDETASGDLDADGWYALAGWKLNPRNQLVLRYDVWNTPSPTSTNGGDENDLTLGWNYFITKHNAKLQLNLVRKNFDLHTDQTLLLTNAQVAF